MNDEYMIRYTNQHGLGCTLVVYATSMAEARKMAMDELGESLKEIKEITNCTLVRELIGNQDFD